MNLTTKNKYINKGMSMEVLVNEIEVKLNKTQVSAIIATALESDDKALRRALAPYVKDMFPQFPTFTQASVNCVDDKGNLRVVLREPKRIEPFTDQADEEAVE
jgi:hypothetical protein